jgi:hypothetical protein
MNHVVLFCLIAVAGSCLCGCEKNEQVSTIEYQGEKFRLKSAVGDYEEFKDEAAIHPDDLARVEAKMLSVGTESVYATKAAFILGAIKLKFPGYAFGALQGSTNVHTVTIELPGAKKHRYITAVEQKSRWLVVADFIAPGSPAGSSVAVEKNEVVFRNYKREEFARRPINAKPETRPKASPRKRS